LFFILLTHHPPRYDNVASSHSGKGAFDAGFRPTHKGSTFGTGEQLEIDTDLAGLEEIARISTHRVHRRYLARDIPPYLVRLLCACALSALSKSDLQQADIVVVREKMKIDVFADLLPEMPWLRETPAFLVFLANGRRLTKICQMRGRPFPN